MMTTTRPGTARHDHVVMRDLLTVWVCDFCGNEAHGAHGAGRSMPLCSVCAEPMTLLAEYDRH
ncbi:hypothetical protein [Cellulomonas bogoriensis]|uniref:Uncharacterized protein n=1 Tax=Cellulomonas bogoriensis 69B4 = DSM 16987 TaxID=1386082 RepID=A0A0A0BWY0_9CELL|nr:hypothetical protein [Cellulomonas bogoriensis]KGM12903.1 hypothetical protein N869_00965 [Cellulomonas bogoriensis 69B4 = DSM 16987]